MRLLFLMPLLWCSFLSADIAVVLGRWLEEYTGERGPVVETYLREYQLWGAVQQGMPQRDESLFFSNLQDSDLSRLKDPSTSIVVFDNIPSWARGDWKEVLSTITAKKILICWEPQLVLPEMYKKEVLSLFDVVLTWNPDLVDNKKIFQFYHPELKFPARKTPSFKKRHILTQISGNKSSNVPNELYSLRLKAIRYFEKHPKKDFRFYGSGWKKTFRTYRGGVNKKLSVLKKYRFSLCFENTRHVRGYLTEKIFDCFEAGCVPVYFGASNIRELIPKRCYIRWESFRNFKDLYTYLKKMPRKKYLKYVKSARKFLFSERAKLFSVQNFVATMLQAFVHAKALESTSSSSKV